jgi:predicted dehydrogenase
MTTRMTLRLIQLGLGGWGRNWVEEVTRATPGVEPVGWVEIDPATRERAIQELKLPPAAVFARLEEAVAAVTADAALVVVPFAAHAEVTRQALDAGLHVLVEKPFTETFAEAAALVDLARAGARMLMVNQNYRWFPAPVRARGLLHENAIGQLVACYLDFHFHYGAGYRYFFLEEPLLSDMAIHHFDTLRYVLDDEPVLISCQSWSEPDVPFKGRPAAVATIRFAKGTLVSYRGSWISRGPITPYGGHWRLDGTGGTIEFTFRGAFEQREKLDRLTLHVPGRRPKKPTLPEMAHKDRAGALAAFARWVEHGEPGEALSSAEDNLKSLALMFAAIRSAREDGRPVPIAEILEETQP